MLEARKGSWRQIAESTWSHCKLWKDLPPNMIWPTENTIFKQRLKHFYTSKCMVRTSNLSIRLIYMNSLQCGIDSWTSAGTVYR